MAEEEEEAEGFLVAVVRLVAEAQAGAGGAEGGLGAAAGLEPQREREE